MTTTKLRTLVTATLLLAIGIFLPFLTGQIQKIGNMLLPMHLPVLLCGLICGWKYGLTVGLILPLLRSVLFVMPVLYPSATAMAFELATYGFVSGFLFSRSKHKSLKTLYMCLIISMISGRIIWGTAQVILLSLGDGVFTFSAFIAGAFVNAVPGIIIQLILIPIIMVSLKRAKFVSFEKTRRNYE